MSSTLEQGYHAIENRPTQEVVNNYSDSGVDASYNPKSLKQVHHVKQIEKNASYLIWNRDPDMKLEEEDRKFRRWMSV